MGLTIHWSLRARGSEKTARKLIEALRQTALDLPVNSVGEIADLSGDACKFEPRSQADPKFQTPLAFTRMTAKAVRQRLLASSKGTGRRIPAERTLHDILNRLGYRLRRVRKTRPQKKSAIPTPFSPICGRSTRGPHKSRRRSASPWTPRPR